MPYDTLPKSKSKKSRNKGFTQNEVKIRNIFEKINKGVTISNPQSVIHEQYFNKELETALNKKLKVEGSMESFKQGASLSSVASYYETQVALKKKSIPPKRSNKKVKQMNPENTIVTDLEKKPTKIERKIIKIFNKVHKTTPVPNFNNTSEDRHISIHPDMLTSDFLQSLDKEFGIFLELNEKNSTIATIANKIKSERKSKKIQIRLDSEKFVSTNIERRESIVFTLDNISINSVSGGHSFETKAKFWKDFDKWYKKFGKKLRSKKRYKSNVLKSTADTNQLKNCLTQ